MNKIPKCLTKNSINQHYLKLSKKFTGEKRIIYQNNPKREKTFNVSKHSSNETTGYSLISTKKQSTLPTSSSKKGSLIMSKKVIYIIFIILYYLIYLSIKDFEKNFIKIKYNKFETKYSF